MFALSNRYDNTTFTVIIWAFVIFAGIRYFRRRGAERTAFGKAKWMTDQMLRAWGHLGTQGLILGRTIGGELLRIPRYVHVLLVGSAGAGKGVSIIIPNLLDYYRGSLVVFDTKTDLFTCAAERRQQMGQRIVRLAPFNGGGDTWNVLDTIPLGDLLLIDKAKAMAEALVVRKGTESDPHWNDKSVQVIAAILILVLTRLSGPERSLNSVQVIASDPERLLAAADILQQMSGIASRFCSPIRTLFEKGTILSKEGSGILSTVARHLSFLDSEMVAASVATSTWDVKSLMEPGVTLFLSIPVDMLEAQKGLLRCWVSTLIRVIGSSGAEDKSEVLFLLDEASALQGLTAIEEALVRGRSAGVRLFLAYQSDSQVTTAFKDKPTILYDNCSTQIYLGASSYETAERISKSCGEWTQVVGSTGENWGHSRSTEGAGGQVSSGGSVNHAQQGRALLRPEEILTLSEQYLIAFVRGLPGPILANRIKWFEDADFNPAVPRRNWWNRLRMHWLWWVVLIVVIGTLTIRAKVNGYGYWQPETQRR